jgi:hypothetical protein
MRQWLWPLAGLAVTAGWAMAATFDAARPRAAAAAAAAVVTAAVVPTTLESLLGAAILLGVLPLAMVRTPLLVASLVVVAAVDLAVTRTASRVVSAVGALLVAAGVALTAIDGYGWRLAPSGRPAAALALAGALALLAGGGTPALLVPGLFAAAVAAPALPHTETAIACAVAGVALAAFDRPGHALAALALGAVPLPAAFLLLAAGVLIAATKLQVALLGAVPGAVALVAALAEQRMTTTTVALGVGLAAIAALTAWRLPGNNNAEPRHVPALVLLGWLTIAPDTWRWAGRAAVVPYQRGAALAAAAAALAVVTKQLQHRRQLSRQLS